nr:MAG TPA: hypothetical protein [Caudoviricetes sp.]
MDKLRSRLDRGEGTYPAALATFTQSLYIFSRAKNTKRRKKWN